jgi:putative endopeptidase
MKISSAVRHYLVFGPTLALALAGCQSSGSTGTAGQPDLLQANLDTTIHPGDDFFTYANGGWLKKHPIPASDSACGIGT